MRMTADSDSTSGLFVRQRQTIRQPPFLFPERVCELFEQTRNNTKNVSMSLYEVNFGRILIAEGKSQLLVTPTHAQHIRSPGIAF